MRNAAPLKYGVLPPELAEFRERCPDKDRLEQMANILLLGRDVDAGRLLKAVGCANKSGRPSLSRVRFYLKLEEESMRPADIPQIGIAAAEQDGLKQYEEMVFRNDTEEDEYD